jgi:PilZ domain
LKARRQYRRFKRRLEVEFSAEGRHYRGISSNFSLGGLFVRTNHAFAPGTLIDLKLHLPAGGAAALKGLVKMALKTPVISLGNGMGVEILERDPVFVDFMKSLTNEEAPLTGEGSAGTESPKEPDPVAYTGTAPQDCFILRCPDCGIGNRVRKSRNSQALRCGKCGASLTPQA